MEFFVKREGRPKKRTRAGGVTDQIVRCKNIDACREWSADCLRYGEGSGYRRDGMRVHPCERAKEVKLEFEIAQLLGLF